MQFLFYKTTAFQQLKSLARDHKKIKVQRHLASPSTLQESKAVSPTTTLTLFRCSLMDEESFSILCTLGKYLGVEKWPGWVTETVLLAFLPQKIWQQWHHQMGLLQVSASQFSNHFYNV